MKKLILSIFLFLIIFITSPFALKAENSDNFALSAISPDKTITKCLSLPQNSVLSALKENDFDPRQDATGFIFSLIGYAGQLSYSPLSSEAFWSFWIVENDHYQFSNLGPSFLHPQKRKSYVFYFSNGTTPPPMMKYEDVCLKSDSAPIDQAIPTNPPLLSSASNNDFSSTFNYLRENFNNQSAADQDWAAIALGAFGQISPIANLSDESVLSLARHLLASASQRQNDPVSLEKIKQSYSTDQFGDPNLINDDIFAVLAVAAFEPEWLSIHQGVFNTITTSQRSDGSFGFKKNGASDIDMTAAAIWALKYKTDYPQEVFQKATDYLDRGQNSDGGYGYQPGQESNVPSSSWAAIAYLALKIKNPRLFSYLLSAKQASGYWLYFNEPSYKSTAYALLALSKTPFAVSPNDFLPFPTAAAPATATATSASASTTVQAEASTPFCAATASAAASPGRASSSASAQCN